MNNDSLIQALDECLELIEQGTAMEQVLLRYPALAADLRPMLEAAKAAVDLVDNIQVPTGAQAHSRATFLNAARAYQHPKPIFGFAKTQSKTMRPKPLMSNLAQAALVLLVIFAIGGATAAGASARSLPGDVLYPVKLVTEQTQLLFTRTAQERLKLDQEFNDERIEEIKTLNSTGSRPTKVDFTGKIESSGESSWQVGGVKLIFDQPADVEEYLESGLYLDISGELLSDGTIKVTELRPREYSMKGKIESLASNEWIVSKVLIRLTNNTTIKGTPGIGLEAEIKGYLSADGSLQAQEIKVKGQKVGEKTQEPESTEPTDKTLEPTRTPRPERTRTETEEPEKTAEPVETRKPEETKTEEIPHETPKPSETPNSSGNN